MKRMIGSLALILSLLSTSASADIANTASVYLADEGSSWVGGAVGATSVTWVHGIDGVFYGNSNFDQGAEISFNGYSSWTFDFAAPTYDPKTNTNNGQPLHVGLYDGATRFPFNSPTKPGLSVFGNGRGDNESSGWFNVLEISYGANGAIDSLAVDFRQYDENLTESGASLYGSLRFNSDIPLTTSAAMPVPEPGSWVLLSLGLGVLAMYRRKRQLA